MFGPDEVADIKITRRRELVFIILSGVFLGTLAVLNILGLSRQIDLSFTIGEWTIPFIVFVGVLPYPITFLCTDFISELYGRRRANTVVWVGLLLNLWVLFILWLGGVLPPRPELDANNLPELTHPNYSFFYIRKLTGMATMASMIAYLTAQFVDVQVFHFLEKTDQRKGPLAQKQRINTYQSDGRLRRRNHHHLLLLRCDPYPPGRDSGSRPDDPDTLKLHLQNGFCTARYNPLLHRCKTPLPLPSS
jgi:uncharacterized integral membrane protein (TIGR00697 family)